MHLIPLSQELVFHTLFHGCRVLKNTQNHSKNDVYV